MCYLLWIILMNLIRFLKKYWTQNNSRQNSNLSNMFQSKSNLNLTQQILFEEKNIAVSQKNLGQVSEKHKIVLSVL